MQNKPNLQNNKIDVSAFIIKKYENSQLLRYCENKANQTRFWVCNLPSLPVKLQDKNIFLCVLLP
jgi:hypothetical protein